MSWGNVYQVGTNHWALLVMWGSYFGEGWTFEGWVHDFFTEEAALAKAEEYRREGMEITVRHKSKRQTPRPSSRAVRGVGYDFAGGCDRKSIVSDDVEVTL